MHHTDASTRPDRLRRAITARAEGEHPEHRAAVSLIKRLLPEVWGDDDFIEEFTIVYPENDVCEIFWILLEDALNGDADSAPIEAVTRLSRDQRRVLKIACHLAYLATSVLPAPTLEAIRAYYTDAIDRALEGAA